MTGEFAVAVHALVYLTHRNTTLCSEALAENICTNPARVRRVMVRLKRADLISTREGAEGGYALALDPAQISLRRVAEAVEGTFVSAAWRPGDPAQDCLVASGMAGLLDELYAGLNRLCLEQLETITVADVAGRLSYE